MYKTVLITGASRGIGRAIACAYAREAAVWSSTVPLREGAAGAGRRIKGNLPCDVLTSIGDVSDYAIWNSFFPKAKPASAALTFS